MDFTRYDKKMQEYHLLHQRYLQESDKRAIRVLKAMLRTALYENDPELIGYLYHSMAFAEYFIMGRYAAFLKNLRLSAKYILQSESQTEFLHIYYLIAIDAMNKGSFDIAHHYFLEAYNIAEEEGRMTEAGILGENIGFILIQLGDYKNALSRFKNSLARIRKDKTHPHYYNNLASGYLGEGVASLHLKKTKRAMDAREKTAKLIEDHADVLQEDIRLEFEIFSLLLLMEQRKTDKEKEKESLSRICTMLGMIPNLHMYTEWIKTLSEKLFLQGKKAEVKKLFLAMESNTIANDAVHALLSLTDLKIDYYLASGKKKELPALYETQDKLYARATRERRKMYRYTKELVELTSELRKGREEAYAEKERLIYKSNTDALTGVFNRYAGVLKLEEVFTHAVREKKRVGIAYMDVDELKHYNDTFGHPEGDSRLAELGRILLRYESIEGYYPARFGGDEFVLIFEDCRTEKIESCVKRLQEETPIGFSAGIHNAVPTSEEKMWDFIAMADKALYREKKKRKKR